MRIVSGVLSVTRQSNVMKFPKRFVVQERGEGHGLGINSRIE